MPSWTQLDLSDATPEGVAEILESAETVAATLSPVLEVAATLVELLATLTAGYSDPYSATLTAIQAAIDELTTLVSNQQVAELHYLNLAKPQSVSAWLSTLVASFNDEADTDRPQFTGADVCCVVMLQGASTPSGLVSAISALFSGLEFEVGFPSTYPELAIDAPQPGTGTYPDWHGISMGRMFGPFGRLIDKLNELKASYEPAIADGLDNFAAALRARSEQLTALAAELETLSQQLADLATLGGMSILVLRLDNANTADLTSAISSAANQPDFGDEAYIAGVGLVFAASASPASAASADFMASLFGGAS